MCPDKQVTAFWKGLLSLFKGEVYILSHFIGILTAVQIVSVILIMVIPAEKVISKVYLKFHITSRIITGVQLCCVITFIELRQIKNNFCYSLAVGCQIDIHDSFFFRFVAVSFLCYLIDKIIVIAVFYPNPGVFINFT